jgi:hypothetical protein
MRTFGVGALASIEARRHWSVFRIAAQIQRLRVHG